MTEPLPSPTPHDWPSRLRQWVRVMGVLLRFGLRADPALVVAYFFVVSIWQVVILARIYATKLIVDAALAADLNGATIGALIYGGGSLILMQCTKSHLWVIFRLEEKTSQVVDRELMEIIGGLPGLQHHEDPRYQNEFNLLRSQRYLLSGMVSAVAQNVRYWLQLFGSAALLAQLHPLLLLLPLFGASSFWAGRRAHRWEVQAQEATAERRRLRRHLFSLATIATAGKELRVFDTAETIISRHAALAREVERETKHAIWRATLIRALGSVGFAVGYLGAVGLVLMRALRGESSPGDVVLAITLASQMNDMVGSVIGVVDYLRNALRAATRYLWMVDYVDSASRPIAEPAPVPAHLSHGITLEGVSFRYPQTDASVLTDVSLHLPAGKVVALVGENGAGKTTLVKLLCRFYEPSQGRILVDGVDLRHLHVAAWRERLSTGFQDFSRFEFTLQDTVGVGDLPHRSDVPRLEHALARAGADGMAATLPSGWATQLGPSWPGGIELSGGQWQKLALARALVRADPLMVIFDEPTAALDAPTEHALFERIAAAARAGATAGTVTLIVSHRFSTVRMADLIVVLDQGRVAEQGSHEHLMQLGGTYAELYNLQAHAYR